MKIRAFKINTQTGEKGDCIYPRGDKTPIEDKINKYYFIEQSDPPKEYDQNKYHLQPVQNLNEKTMICDRGYKLVERSKEEVIQLLNNSLLIHLNGGYSIEDRIEYIEEIQDDSTKKEQKDHIKALRVWKKNQQAECKNRGANFIDNNIFPSFEWQAKPKKI